MGVSDSWKKGAKNNEWGGYGTHHQHQAFLPSAANPAAWGLKAVGKEQ